MEIEFVIDGGAYCTLSPVVLSRGTIHAAGPYYCPHVRIRSSAVATNIRRTARSEDSARRRVSSRLSATWIKSPHAVGLTPDEFRRRNFVHEGETTATSQVIREKVEMDQLLDRAFELTGLPRKARTLCAHENPTSTIEKGIGFASFMHGAGFTGSGEVYLHQLWALKQRQKDRCEFWRPAQRLDREQIRSFRRSQPRLWELTLI